jgi:hypothetical protein
MSLNKIIIGFIIILILFSGFVLYQMNKSSASSLPMAKVTIDKQVFSSEVATTSAQQQQGLSDRKSLAQDHGMLFTFSTAQRYPFWMKDMEFPLDILFINNNKIVTIFQNIPVPQQGKTNLPVYVPSAPANQVLEINAGLAKKYDFQKGDTVTVDLQK